MPVYNCEPYLDEAIRSIREQTFGDFEFVIVNDGSTDRSLEIIERHATVDPRIVVLDRPNGGIVDALNAGLAVCKGEFIARMDGDDIALPERLTAQYQWMLKNPQCMLLGAATEVIDAEGRSRSKCLRPTSESEIIANSISTGVPAICHPTFFLRRHVLELVGDYRPESQLAEDLDLILRVATVGRVANLDQVLLKYRVHASQTSHSYNLMQTLAAIDVLRFAGDNHRQDSTLSVARLLQRASWQATDLGETRRGVALALESWRIAPRQFSAYRAVARALVFACNAKASKKETVASAT